MHDGLKGRKHVYSYILHNDAWWKIVDHEATKVRSLPCLMLTSIQRTHHVLVGHIRDGLERQGWDASGGRAFPPHLQSLVVRTPCERMAQCHQGQR